MHFEGPQTVDIRLTRVEIRRIGRLAADPRVDLRNQTADWVKVTFSSQRDLDFVLDLVRVAIEAHRPQAPKRPW